jgi:predicted ABC-type transport system involved in lysophospholipase L1 biosynthesis ATPase subunit
MRMSIALEIHGLRKRYTVGVGGCLAVADVLRDVDVVLHTGEALAVVGPRGSGKTTLMLCAAGLLAADAGELRWFGDSARAAAGRHALYHHAPVDLLRTGAADEPHVHLLDIPALDDGSDAMDAWIAQRCDRGDAVLLASSSEAIASRLGARVLALRAGRLHSAIPAAARVAERVRR